MHSWIRQDGEESDTDASFDERLTDDIPSTCGGRRPVRAKSNASKCTQSPFITPAKQERQTLHQVQNLSTPGSSRSEDQSLRKAIMMEEGKVSPSNYKKKHERKKECYKVQNLSIPGSFMSEDQTLLRHRQNIQRIQQRPPFLGVANNLQKAFGATFFY
uniref:Uncharacterized protein n=1 Tax=Meloidogyne enterolobii TaxID=390850 RepID=A0A6V7TS02_MELEN|nr:unnamed protein product [Meloidogyne enterolobii]